MLSLGQIQLYCDGLASAARWRNTMPAIPERIC